MAKWIDKKFNASFITPYSRDILIPNLMVFGRLVQKKDSGIYSSINQAEAQFPIYSFRCIGCKLSSLKLYKIVYHHRRSFFLIFFVDKTTYNFEQIFLFVCSDNTTIRNFYCLFSSFYLQKNRLKLFMIALSDFRNRQTNEELYLRLFLWNFLEENPASVIYMNSGHSFNYQSKSRR